MTRILIKTFCLFCFLLVASCDSSVTVSPDGAVEPFEKARVVLPSDSGIAIRWVMTPLEDDALAKSRRNRYNMKFSVGPDGTPWIGYNDKYIMIPAIPVNLEVLNGYQDLTQLENGAIFFSKPKEFGFMASAKRPIGLFSSRQKTNSASLVAVQPISQLPIPNCRMFRGENNCLYFSGLNKSTSQYDVYLLRQENATVDDRKIKTLKGYTLVFSNPKKINAVTGDGNTTYIAIENTILSIDTGAKAAENIFVHPGKTITQLQYNNRSGLFYSTNDKIGYVGENGHLEFFSRGRSQISLNKSSLYVFSENDFGVFAFDNIDALSRMNLHINRMVPKKQSKPSDEKPEIFAQLGHLDDIDAIAFSPDGKFVISGESPLLGDDSVKIWDSNTGKEIRTIKWPEGDICFVTMSQNNRYALASGRKKLKVWDILNGETILEISLPELVMRAWATFSPDGKIVSVLSRSISSSTLNIWDVSSGTNIKTIKGFSTFDDLPPSTKYIVKSEYQGNVICDALTSEPVKRLPGVRDINDKCVYDQFDNRSAFSDNCDYAALRISFKDNTLALRDLKRNTRSELKLPGKPLKLNISNQGKFVGAVVELGKDPNVKSDKKEYAFMVWEFNSRKKICDLKLPKARFGPVSALSPDWSQVVVGCPKGKIKILDTATGKELLSIVAEQTYKDAAAKKFDRYLATCSFYANPSDENWVIWDVHEGKLADIANLTKVKQMSYISKNSFNEEKLVLITSRATSSDENYHTVFFNGTVKLYNSKTEEEIAQFILYNDGEWIVITPEGYYNASANGAKHLSARVGKTVYGIENYREKYFRPDLVKAALADVYVLPAK